MSVPERRLTQFPGSSSLGKRRAKTQPEGRSETSTSKISAAPEFVPNQHRAHPPPIPLKANATRFPVVSRFPSKTERIAICQKGNPWQMYYGILREDQAGQVTVAYKNEIEHPVFAVKEHTCEDSTNMKNLIRCSHRNIVCLYDAYLEKDSLYLIYESVSFSLAEIQSTQYGKLAAYQIAAVCREVCSPEVLQCSLMPVSGFEWCSVYPQGTSNPSRLHQCRKCHGQQRRKCQTGYDTHPAPYQTNSFQQTLVKAC